MVRASSTHWQARPSSEDYPFDAWLHRALEERYRRVLSEPLPPEWLAMITQDDMAEEEDG